MKKGEFIINGISSTELNSYIQKRPLIPTPRRDIELREVSSVSGAYVFDFESYKNSPFDLELYTKADTPEALIDLQNRIKAAFSTGRYNEIVFYHQPDYTFYAVTTGEPDFEPNGLTPLLLPYKVSLSAKPYKLLRGIPKATGTTQKTLINPTLHEAEPIIRINATGDAKLIVNGKEFVFKNIDGHIMVDSTVENAYKLIAGGIDNRNDRMYTIDFPRLQPGSNLVSVSGAATSFEIETGWRTLV